MKNIFIAIILSSLFISCTKNDYLNNSIDKAYIEFSKSSFIDSISYLESGIYELAIPIQSFGAKVRNDTTIKLKLVSENFML